MEKRQVAGTDTDKDVETDIDTDKNTDADTDADSNTSNPAASAANAPWPGAPEVAPGAEPPSALMGTAPDSAHALKQQVVDSAFYVDGKRHCTVAIDDMAHYCAQSPGWLWTALCDPSPTLLTKVGDEIGLSDHALEEVLAPHRRPKVIEYGSFVLIVGITAELQRERPAFGELQIIIGRDVLVTVRRGASNAFSSLRTRLQASPDLMARGSDYVAAELLDLLVDHYAATAALMEKVVESAEQKLLMRGAKDNDIRRLYRQRRDLLRTHVAIAPMAEICRRLSRTRLDYIDPEVQPYFGEVADRVARVDELLNALREALAFAFEAGQMIAQGQQNETTRRLASWAAILAVPTAVAGIYGMNFKYMPELDWHYGYPATMFGVLCVCSFLYWRFRKSGWL